jgi:hypothetical protein
LLKDVLFMLQPSHFCLQIADYGGAQAFVPMNGY